MGENYIVMPKPEKGAVLNPVYDLWKTVKQTLTVAAPGIVGFLVFLQGCQGFDDLTIPIAGGVGVSVVVGTIYRVFKNISVEGVPLSK